LRRSAPTAKTCNACRAGLRLGYELLLLGVELLLKQLDLHGAGAQVRAGFRTFDHSAGQGSPRCRHGQIKA
jgi:hypothetical protein